MNEHREDLEKDFYKAELIKMGYFKTPAGKQLYELKIERLRELYAIEKAKFHNNIMK